jgi:hypothetical protein
LAAAEARMSLSTIVIIILILLLIGVIPSWSHSRSWGYGPSGVLGVILVIVIIVLLTRGQLLEPLTSLDRRKRAGWGPHRTMQGGFSRFAGSRSRRVRAGVPAHANVSSRLRRRRRG